MAGNRAGGLKAAETNKKKYGEDFYVKMGKKGGLAQVPKGFSMNPKLASKAGRKGGKNSKRGPAKKEVEDDEVI